MLPQDFGIAFPRQPPPARAATQPLPPDATDSPIELPETLVVCRSPVILVVAAELGVEDFLLLSHRLVPVLLAPFGDRLQPPAEPLPIVFTWTVNFPFRLRAQMCVNPRKSTVAGFFPCPFAFLSAFRPNSTSRVFSG